MERLVSDAAYELTQILRWQIRKQLYPEITNVLYDLTVNITETDGRFQGKKRERTHKNNKMKILGLKNIPSVQCACDTHCFIYMKVLFAAQTNGDLSGSHIYRLKYL